MLLNAPALFISEGCRLLIPHPTTYFLIAQKMNTTMSATMTALSNTFTHSLITSIINQLGGSQDPPINPPLNYEIYCNDSHWILWRLWNEIWCHYDRTWIWDSRNTTYDYSRDADCFFSKESYLLQSRWNWNLLLCKIITRRGEIPSLIPHQLWNKWIILKWPM